MVVSNCARVQGTPEKLVDIRLSVPLETRKSRKKKRGSHQGKAVVGEIVAAMGGEKDRPYKVTEGTTGKTTGLKRIPREKKGMVRKENVHNSNQFLYEREGSLVSESAYWIVIAH